MDVYTKPDSDEVALFDSVTVLVGNGDPLVSLVSGNKSDRKLYSSRCEKDSPLVVLYTLPNVVEVA